MKSSAMQAGKVDVGIQTDCSLPYLRLTFGNVHRSVQTDPIEPIKRRGRKSIAEKLKSVKSVVREKKSSRKSSTRNSNNKMRRSRSPEVLNDEFFKTLKKKIETKRKLEFGKSPSATQTSQSEVILLSSEDESKKKEKTSSAVPVVSSTTKKAAAVPIKKYEKRKRQNLLSLIEQDKSESDTEIKAQQWKKIVLNRASTSRCTGFDSPPSSPVPLTDPKAELQEFLKSAAAGDALQAGPSDKDPLEKIDYSYLESQLDDWERCLAQPDCKIFPSNNAYYCEVLGAFVEPVRKDN